MSQDGIVNAEQINAGMLSSTQQAGTVVTLGAAGTISPTPGVVRVTAAAAVAGLIIGVGTKPGQILTVVHEGAAANTLTMAAAGTSNVANGVSCVITGPSARSFVWDSVTALWYQLT